MERKIGEIFEFKKEWYQCVEGVCKDCHFSEKRFLCKQFITKDFCTHGIIFKKLEKVGEPYILENKKFQKYRVFHTPYIYNKIDCSWQSFADPYYISLEIKQNKEDMEEKNQDIIEFQGKKYKFIPCEEREACSTLCAFKNLSQRDCWDIPCSLRERRDGLKGYFVELSIEEIAETPADEVKRNIENQAKNNMETSKLKPFDLQKAKEGKPVCTRDGRKARIICFDRNDLYPIVALIECEDGKEIIGAYSKEGQTEIYEIKGTNLMMLPEKKEGWVNVYKGGLLDTKSYNTKKEAFDKACPKDYVDTVKINWEE